MKKSTRITLILIISIVMIAVVGLTIYGYVQKYAYADYIDVATDPNAIVNFNQYIQNNYINNTISTYFSNTLPVGSYFIRIDSNVNTRILFVYTGGAYYQKNIIVGQNEFLITFSNEISAIQFDNAITFTNFNAINLTQMYGVYNLPNLTQCQELFVSVYSYNTGTAMPANGFSMYSQGYQDAYDAIQANLTYSIVASDVYNNATNFDLGNYCGEVLKATDPNIYYIYTNPNPTFNDEAQYANGFYMPFNTTISGGAVLKLQGCIATYMGFAEQLQPIYCAVVTNGQVRNLYTFDHYIVGSGDVGNLLKASYDLTLTMPYDCNGLYFYSLEQFACANLSVMVQNFDLQTAIASARQTAQSQAEEYYTKLYSVGGERYEQIFNSGKQYALTHNANNAWGSAWDFIESAFTGIGGIFAVQLLPGVPLSVFILVPLMISLIFFIVKLTKGGGD